jgi:ferredoxin-NADP reductase
MLAGRRLDGFKAYAAGPPAMVHAARSALVALGLPAIDIHVDAFYTDAEAASAAGAQA